MSKPLITYNSITVDFPEGAGAQNLIISNSEKIARTQAKSGKQKYLHFFRNRFIKFTLPYYDKHFENQLTQLYEYQRTGQSVKLHIDQDVGLYLPFEGKEANSADEDSATFTRIHGANDVAYVDDHYTGLITEVATGVQRFEEGKFGAATLIEDSATNLINRTEEFDDANWTKTDCVVTANQAIAPDGNVTADELVFTGISLIYFDTTTAIGTDNCCFSIWLKTLSGEDSIYLYINNDAGTIKATYNANVTSEWQKFSVRYENDGADANNWRFLLGQLGGTTTIHAWGSHTDVGLLYPTSYVMNDGESSGARQEEVLYYTLNDDNFNKKQFSISCWIKVPYDSDQLDDNRFIFAITKSGASDVFSFLRFSSANNIRFAVYDYEDNSFLATSDGDLISADTWYQITVTCDVTIANGLKIYLNGSLIETSTTDAFSPNDFDRIYIGSLNDGTKQLNGLIDDFCIHRKVLTAAQISQYYNSNAGWGYQKNIWDNVYLKNHSYETKFVNGTRKIVGTTLEFEEKLT